MLHGKISRSIQLGRLTLPAKLLFTWLISHADDEGRIRGEPEYIKATVFPMTRYSFKKIRIWLEELAEQELIYRWDNKGEQVIEIVKWYEHQTLRKSRFIPSDLPSFPNPPVDRCPPKWLPEDNHKTAQSNVIESNLKESNAIENSEKEHLADKKSSNGPVNPKNFEPSCESEVAAKEVWQKLEPHNAFTFKSIFLKAKEKGLPANLFYQFASEIEQDPTVKNKGAVFAKKAEGFFDGKR